MIVFCDRIDCTYSDGTNCCANCITLDEDGYCNDFEYYEDLPQYQSEYFIVVKVDDNKLGKLRVKGRKIELNGYTFYTNGNYGTRKDNVGVTEGRTGVYIASIKELKEKWALFTQREKEIPDVSKYPEVVKIKGKYEYLEQPTTTETSTQNLDLED